MTVADVTTADSAAPNPNRALDRRSLRNIGALFCAQAICGGQLVIHVTFGPLVGAMLAADAGWATAPITVMVLANMIAVAPASTLMGSIGRKPGFMIGLAFGALGGALGAYAIVVGSFPLFLAASACAGVYQAHQNLFRFAATDTCSERFKPTAISWVLGGGLLSSIIGPAIGASFDEALAPIPIAGAYLAIIGLNLVGLPPILALDIPKPRRPQKGESRGRSLLEMLRAPVIRVAILCGMVSYTLMTLVMTSASSAIVGCGYSRDAAIAVIGAHVFAMFTPSFFTGALINRFGHTAILTTGLCLLALCGVVATSGVALENFFIALMLLGVGWNFGFIGASSLLATAHSAEERSKIQGFNDFCIFGLVALGSLSSGQLLHGLGWTAVNMAMVPLLTIAAGALIWLTLMKRRDAAAPQAA